MIYIGHQNYFQALLFDLNGTLIEIYKISEYERNLHAICDALRVNYELFVKAWSKTWQNYPYGDYPSVAVRMKDALKYYYMGTEYTLSEADFQLACDLRFRYIANQQEQIRPGVLEVFRWAQAEGLKLGIVSNCSIENPLSWPSNPMASFIPDPVFSCIVKKSKPDPAIFQIALDKFEGISAEHCIYIADGDDHEMDTARSLGMEPILFRYDLTDAYRHYPFPEVRYIIDHFDQLPGMIKKIESTKNR